MYKALLTEALTPYRKEPSTLSSFTSSNVIGTVTSEEPIPSYEDEL